MGKKRTAPDIAEEGPSNSQRQQRPQQQEASAAAPPTNPQQAANRRDAQAQIARQRAAHFATWKAGDEEDNNDDANPNPHVGNENARQLGPWSTAVQLANAREGQLQRRNDKLRENITSPTTDKNPTTIWKPIRDVSLGPRLKNNVQPLLAITMKLVVEYIEDVESLYGLPELVKSRIAAAVCKERAMYPAAFLLFCVDSPSEVNCPNCTALEPEAMQDGLEQAWTPHLQKLSLGLCGRGLTDAVVTDLARNGAMLPMLCYLKLTGAYRLADQALSSLLKKVPALTHLSLPYCSRVTGDFLSSLPNNNPSLQEIDLSECRGIGATQLSSSLSSLPHLRSLYLDGIPEVDDKLLETLTKSCGALEALSLSRCTGVSDKTLKAIAKNLPMLRVLCVDECKITDDGVVSLAAGCISQLSIVSLGGCAKLTDTAIKAVAAVGCLRNLHVNGVVHLTDESIQCLVSHCAGTLEEIDISWCREVGAEAMGLLVDGCKRMKKVVAYGCIGLEEQFLFGHSNEGVEIVGRGEQLVPVVLPF